MLIVYSQKKIIKVLAIKLILKILGTKKQMFKFVRTIC